MFRNAFLTSNGLAGLLSVGEAAALALVSAMRIDATCGSLCVPAQATAASANEKLPTMMRTKVVNRIRLSAPDCPAGLICIIPIRAI